ncbi:hypothetical protein Q5752_006025 [Cryptotrichosporon argae]
MEIPKPDTEPEPDICRSSSLQQLDCSGKLDHTPATAADVAAQHAAYNEKRTPVTHLHHAARPASFLTPSPPGEAIDNVPDHALVQPGFLASLKATIKAVPLLLVVPVLLPIAWALHFTDQNAIAVFVVSLLAICPLAGGLGFATEELAVRVGDAWGGLLNASFGNAVELLVAVLALVKGDVDIVQASMVGSILSNVLLVLGMSYFAGGLRFHEQEYLVVGAQTHVALLGMSMIAIVLPAAYHYAYPSTSAGRAGAGAGESGTASAIAGPELDALLRMSRGLSFILLAVYAMFLTFTLWTHAYLFRRPRNAPLGHVVAGPAPDHARVFPRPGWVPSIADSSDAGSIRSRSRSDSTADTGVFRRFRRRRSTISSVSVSVSGSLPLPTPSPGAHDIEAQAAAVPLEREPADQALSGSTLAHTAARAHDPKVHKYFAIGLLVTMTGLAGVTAECLVSSIDGLTEASGVTREFVGLVLLPVVGNAVEHVTAVTVSVKDKLDLSLSIAVGSSVQVALCLLPVLVLVGWAIGQPMTLRFDTFETITLVVAIMLVNWAIADGRTNYLEGFVLMMAYLSIALVCWFYDPAI